MTEVLFYHLDRQGWEKILPLQLKRASERGWRCTVQVAEEPQIDTVSDVLWQSEVDLFLAHGTEQDGYKDQQPIWITASNENVNHSTVRFFIEGAVVDEITDLARAVILFDGKNNTAVDAARLDWKRFKAEGHTISYWQQNEEGQWINKASSS